MCLTIIILDELVFAIPTDRLWKLLPYTKMGLIKGNRDVLDRIVQNGMFRKRSLLEEDTSFKQLIPYAIISNKGSFYLFRRISGQREKRLINQLHLGVGGHMNPGAPGGSNIQYLVSELKRELFEEVKLLNGCIIVDIEFIGFINDDTIPVSKVHLGLLYIIHVSNKHVIINEKDKMKAEWIDKNEISEYYEEMETWTKIAVDSCIKI